MTTHTAHDTADRTQLPAALSRDLASPRCACCATREDEERAFARLAASTPGTPEHAAARTDIERRNLKLVVSLARPFLQYAGAASLTLGDLVGYGAIGLQTAVLRFDPARGFRFSTYAAHWIRHHIGRAIADCGRTIRIPVQALEQVRRVMRAVQALGGPLVAADEAVAERSGCTLLVVARCRTLAATVGWGDVISLDAPAAGCMAEDGDALTRGAMLPDPAEPADEALVRAEHEATLPRLLRLLDAKHRRVIEARFGLGGEAPLKLHEVGAEFGLSRERVRQLESAALQRLRGAAVRLSMPAGRRAMALAEARA